MKVLAIVAHPDDEIIGLGGTLCKHRKNGDEVKVIIACEGKSSRYSSYEEADKSSIEKFRSETIEANRELLIEDVMLYDLPNNRLDRIELLDLVKKIEDLVKVFQPELVYTHFHGDLNIDHERISRATVTACRTLPGSTVEQLLFFETLSSTEHSERLGHYFTPNYFVEISAEMKQKLAALKHYQSELRSMPHPRNIKSVKMNNQVNGNKIGLEYAEAFMVGYILKRNQEKKDGK